MKLFLRILILTLCIVYNGTAFAQHNFYKWSGEAGIGINYLFADASKRHLMPQFHVSTEYNLMRFISLGAKLQMGKTAGMHIPIDTIIINSQGEFENDTRYLSEFQNSFFNVQLFGKANLGMFLNKYDLDKKFLKIIYGLYAGAGVAVQRNSINEYDRPYVGVFYTQIKSKAKSHSVSIPIIAGYEYFFKDANDITRWSINANYQLTFGLDDELDGNFRSKNPGRFNDFNNTVSIGIRYFFGPYGLDKNR